VEEASSSLDAALELAEKGSLGVWDSLLAARQTAGRGQLRRQWISPPGNLYAALRLPLSAPFSSTAASVAVGGLLVGALEKMGWPVQLKWPNDIVAVIKARPRKLGGILLEERRGVLLAGVGLNVTSAPEADMLRRDAAMPAASLAGLTDSPPGVETLWRRLVKHAYSVYTEEDNYCGRWREQVERLLLWRGEMVALTDEKGTARGVLQGLAPSGAACLRLCGETKEFWTGSMSPACSGWTAF
jgi:BirA family biotin operon repressor/biotin-[acetyl-CoA-carboxylase] ligase